MACRVSYETVAADLSSTAESENGLNDTLIKHWLWSNGWAWQEVTRNLFWGNAFVPLHPWPPRPFASTHICFVEATAGWHYCVLDFDGRVYDPWSEVRTSLNHADYKRVASVTGLFRVATQQRAR